MKLLSSSSNPFYFTDIQLLYLIIAKVLSRFNNIILARVFAHSDVEELAEHGTVPGLLHSFFFHSILSIFSDKNKSTIVKTVLSGSG